MEVFFSNRTALVAHLDSRGPARCERRCFCGLAFLIVSTSFSANYFTNLLDFMIKWIAQQGTVCKFCKLLRKKTLSTIR